MALALKGPGCLLTGYEACGAFSCCSCLLSFHPVVREPELVEHPRGAVLVPLAGWTSSPGALGCFGSQLHCCTLPVQAASSGAVLEACSLAPGT